MATRMNVRAHLDTSRQASQRAIQQRGSPHPSASIARSATRIPDMFAKSLTITGTKTMENVPLAFNVSRYAVSTRVRTEATAFRATTEPPRGARTNQRANQINCRQSIKCACYAYVILAAFRQMFILQWNFVMKFYYCKFSSLKY